jgi:hypothetical protein
MRRINGFKEQAPTLSKQILHCKADISARFHTRCLDTLTAEFAFKNGGEIGIRTLGTVTGTPHFECGAFDHSAISPHVKKAWSLPEIRRALATERGH